MTILVKGNLRTLCAVDANGDPRPLLVDGSGNLMIVDSADKAAGVPTGVPRGRLITPVVYDGENPHPLLVDGDGKLIVTGLPAGAAPIVAMARRTSNWTVPLTAFTKLDFNSEYFDLGDFFNLATDTWVIPESGNYGLVFGALINMAYYRYYVQARWFKNGTGIGTVYSSYTHTNLHTGGVHAHYYGALTEGDNITLRVRKESASYVGYLYGNYIVGIVCKAS